uniref:Uncharacterized protein n=1 Tax=Kalanchoe fedtschenkoi TaxID=63787 RepID=A0A7N0R8T0_KALFE
MDHPHFHQKSNLTKCNRIDRRRKFEPSQVEMDGLVKMVKSKLKGLKRHKRYTVMERSTSFQKEIHSRNARNLIDRTLAVADKQGKRCVS